MGAEDDKEGNGNGPAGQIHRQDAVQSEQAGNVAVADHGSRIARVINFTYALWAPLHKWQSGQRG